AGSIDNAPVAVAKNARDSSSQRDLVDRVRLRGGDIEPVVFETQVPQSLRGYRRERRDAALPVDLQHLVVPVINDVNASFAIEGNAIGTLDEMLFANDEADPVGVNLATEFPRQFETYASSVCLFTAIQYGPIRPLLYIGAH